MSPSTIEIAGALIFALAIAHTFSTGIFEHLAHTRPKHAGLWHLLGEVEVVFGFWAVILAIVIGLAAGSDVAVEYIDTRNYTEPLFVFAIMIVAASNPILQTASQLLQTISRLLPLPYGLANYFCILAIVPLLGSLITEPAAMTLAAFLLRDRFFTGALSEKAMYATLGTLFVNISIGGTLTSFAAPPVLMVASAWQWDSAFMFSHFGWKAAIAVTVNAGALTFFLRKTLGGIQATENIEEKSIPVTYTLVHLLLLSLIVLFAHHPAVFLGVFLIFMGLANAYPAYQTRLIVREGLLVAFFLAGLVVLGGQQAWWLQPLLTQMSATSIFYGAVGLTALTDNAALTYLGSLVQGLSDEFKYSLVAGAVTGGGLTVIANAPNPAGVSILRHRFSEGTISPLQLLLAALGPTFVAIAAFQLL